MMADGGTIPRANGPPGIWTFIAADCAGFAVLFLVFMTERMKQPALFDASARMLDVRLGMANTLILITSGWLVALATDAAEHGRHRAATWRLIGALAVGSGFAALKILEYSRKIAAGIVPTTNDFFAFYYILTGVHFLHYAIGIAVLIAMIVLSRRAGVPRWLESGALYWHMVDLLWLFLFPMLYLLAGDG